MGGGSNDDAVAPQAGACGTLLRAVHHKVSLVLSYRYPGKYAFNVLAGALQEDELAGRVEVHFPSNFETLKAATEQAAARGGPVVVAWSFYSMGLPEAEAEHRALRAALPDVRFLSLAGGVHATAEPEQTLRAGFDFVAVGEGEHTIRSLVDRLGRGEDPAGTHGLWRLVDGKVKSNGRGEGVDLDAFPPFASHRHRYGAIELTRGCIYACRFCQTPYMAKARFRHRSVENTARWVKAIRDAGKTDIRFISPTSLSYGSQDGNVNLDAVEALLSAVRAAAGPDGRVYFGTFPSEVRPEHVTPEALRLLKKYVDNDNLIIGGQSGSDRVLTQSKRGHDVETIRRAVDIAVGCGFVPNVDFILGLPGEESEDVRATVELMHQLADKGARVHGHTFMPLPGTPFRNAAPGQVDGPTRLALERLASRGMLYGHWKAQQKTAAELAERRTNRQG